MMPRMEVEFQWLCSSIFCLLSLFWEDLSGFFIFVSVEKKLFYMVQGKLFSMLTLHSEGIS